MKQIFKSIAVSIFIPALLLSCKKQSPVAGDPANGTGNTIKGTIFDAKGNKFSIDNATVLVHIWSHSGNGGNDIVYNINMDDKSHYEQKVTPGLYAFDARMWTSLNGNVVSIPLDPVDGQSSNTQFNSAPGVTRDFSLRLTGLIPGGDANDANSYYGGKISVCDGAGNFTPTGNQNNLAAKYPGSTVIFTLTPKGPCLDGSNAPLKDISVSVGDLQNAGRCLVNFPLAKYYLSAILRKPSGQQYPLKLTFVSGATGNHYDLLTITFAPAANDPECRPPIIFTAVWE